MASAESLGGGGGGGGAAPGCYPGSAYTFYEENKIQHENGLHKNQELGTLCNISGNIVPTGKLNSSFESPEYVRRTVRRFEDQEQDTGDTEFSSLPAVKKPSYLGISCSLSGYSSLTSYDSKVREGFRSRDKSPAPPPPRLLSSMPNKEAQNGIGSSLQAKPISTPSEKQPPSPPTGSQSPLQRHNPTTTHGTLQNVSQSPGRYKEGIFSSTEKSSFSVDETDQTACYGKPNLLEKKMSMNSSLPSIDPQTPLKRSPGAVRVTEFTCQTKSFIQTKTPSGDIQQVNISPERPNVPLNGVPSELHTDSVSVSAVLEESPKSFVQQRIERLYGPGALGQGFLSRVRKPSATPDEAPQQVSPVPSIPQLPVLRHLRPEFRAQLPLTSSPLSKSSRSLETSSSPVPRTPAVGSPKYRSIDLTDFQHAAPEVPVMKAEASPLPSASTFFTDPDLTPVILRPVVSDTLGKEVASEVVAEEDLCRIVEEKNGHHFLRVLHKEIERLNDLANKAEEELSSTEGLSDDVQGKLRSASGQARLLVKQKLQQFEGLCIKNISQYPGEPFPTTAQDLEGFWDMVKLQIDHVDLMFLEIDSLRKNNWKEIPESQNLGTVNGSRRRQTTRHNPTKHGNGSTLPPAASSGGPRSKVVQQSSSDKKRTDSARRSREEQALARKKMMEERRQALKAQQAKTEQHVEIYVASRNGK